MNAVTERITPSITSMIRLDHSQVMAVFHRYRPETSIGRKRALVKNVCLSLEVHAQLEEEIFYPALRNVMSGDDVLEKSQPEHDRMRQMIGELRQMCSNDSSIQEPAFDEKFLELMRLVIHHVADEETRLLPAAERLLPDQLGRLGMDMTKRRLELMKPHAAEFAETTVRSFPAGAAAGAALLTAGAVAVGAMLLSRSNRKNMGSSMSRWRH
ncbi:hemerythrin domain-containing protein [Steroidobacter flavus]|uniref:Hemerythrin domain-containing protein n=1 Tax=Steroidobacter flavus TaxID=1842136 RepID=A0ABV8SPK7_9GAMM